MSAAPPNPQPVERRGYSIPRALWIILAAVVLLVVAVGLHVGIPIYRHEVAIEEINRLSGKMETRPRDPQRLRQRGEHERMMRFDELIGVELVGSEVSDDTLRNLKGVTQLKWLTLAGTQVTDAGLAHLAELTQLQWLRLDNTKVTDAGLAHLTGLTRLRNLCLDNTQVTDLGLAHLSGLAKLQWLWLGNTRVTDAGLVHVSGLTRLQGVWLGNTQVTDAGIAELQHALPAVTIIR